MKKDKEEYGTWKKKIENKILENAAENLELMRIEKIEQVKERKEKEV